MEESCQETYHLGFQIQVVCSLDLTNAIGLLSPTIVDTLWPKILNLWPEDPLHFKMNCLISWGSMMKQWTSNWHMEEWVTEAISRYSNSLLFLQLVYLRTNLQSVLQACSFPTSPCTITLLPHKQKRVYSSHPSRMQDSTKANRAQKAHSKYKVHVVVTIPLPVRWLPIIFNKIGGLSIVS